MDDGARSVTYITEVQGFEQDTVLLQDIFQLDWMDRGGQRMSELMPGRRPPADHAQDRKGAHLPGARFLRAAPGHHGDAAVRR